MANAGQRPAPAQAGARVKCLVLGCNRGDVTLPMEGVPVCHAHYAELWAHLDGQDEAHQNWPGSEPVIRAWVKAKQKRETEVRHAQANG